MNGQIMAEKRLRVVLDTAASPSAGETRANYLKALLDGGVAVTSTGRGGVAPLDDDDLLILGEHGSDSGPGAQKPSASPTWRCTGARSPAPDRRRSWSWCRPRAEASPPAPGSRGFR
ncbi:MAG: hypothetical protein AAF725_07285 [Acidobacteriota bacterium]